MAPPTVGAGVTAKIGAGATGDGVGRKETFGADVGEKVASTGCLSGPKTPAPASEERDCSDPM